MDTLPNLPPNAYAKADPSPDPLFYRQARLVTHIDDMAIAAVTALYRRVLPAGEQVLDLMGSWVSHLPPEVDYDVVGHGMNADELAANPRLERWFVQDLNADPVLPLMDHSVDAVTICVSVQYLQRPVAVFRDLARVLRQRGPVVVTFSNRCFPTKAVAIWQALEGPQQQQLVAASMRAAGLTGIETEAHTPRRGDPVWAVIGRAP